MNAATEALIPSEEEIVARAEALIPWLRERADACEKARMVSPETIQKFQEAGFFKILQPKRWGGYEMHPNVLNKVLMELARGCPSSAWPSRGRIARPARRSPPGTVRPSGMPTPDCAV